MHAGTDREGRVRTSNIYQVMDTAFVELSDGSFAVADAADIPLLETYLWSPDFHGYAKSHRLRTNMHRWILGVLHGSRVDVDHINRDKSDNRRANLRIVTRNQNEHNKPVRRNNTSGFIGVCWDGGKRRWMAFAKRDYKFVCIGRFVSKLDAARAYDAWVIANRDEYAATNFPRDSYQRQVA